VIHFFGSFDPFLKKWIILIKNKLNLKSIGIDIDTHMTTKSKNDFMEGFVIHGSTPIKFGKLKGRPHKELLDPCNSKYAKWIKDQGSEFRYKETRDFVVAGGFNEMPSELFHNYSHTRLGKVNTKTLLHIMHYRETHPDWHLDYGTDDEGRK